LIIGDSYGKVVTFTVGLICWGLIYISSKKNENNSFALMKLCILSLPLSFVNIFGGSYSSLPVSWFNLFTVFLLTVFFTKILIRGKLITNPLSILSICMVLISVIPLLNSINFLDGLKQFINVIISLMLIIISTNLKPLLNDSQKEKLMKDYIVATKVTALGLFIQIFYVNVVNDVIGTYVLYAGTRHTYSFLFSDASFLSLFLSTGALFVYFTKGKYGKTNVVWITEMGILILASISTSARTGIFAFVVVFGLYSVIVFYKLILKGSIKAIFIAVFSLIILIISYSLVVKVRQTDFLNDSGRFVINEAAFNVFLDNPLIGIGYGISSYNELVGTIPHNIFFQSLAQGGLIYTIPLCIFLFFVLWISYRRYKPIFPILLCVLIGAMLIPDIFNSRFFPILLLILSILI